MQSTFLWAKQGDIMHDNSGVKPTAILAADIPTPQNKSSYPEPFASRVVGREKRKLGDFFGLNNFGVNLTTLAPHSQSALLHWHLKQDELIYILEGNPTLITGDDAQELSPGMCAGFPANGVAHQLVNNSDHKVVYLEIGDRTPADVVTYPNDDLQADLDAEGAWVFSHKDNSPY